MKAIRLAILLSVAMALAGCEKAFQSSAARNLAQAETKYSQGDYPAAVLLYEGALDGTPESAEIHYKLGLLYADRIKRPISAIHHFQRYLDIKPEGPHAKEVQKFLKEDQLRLVAESGNGASVSQEEAKRMKNNNLALQQKVLQLKEELEAANKARLAAFKALGSKAGALKPEQTQKPLVEGVRTYTVEPGDTLASIALKFYKNRGRWQAIQDANFNTMEGTAKLKPGMVLMVP